MTDASRQISLGKLATISKVCSMNYLAHAYLSFNQPAILLGNMISDYIKGRKQFDYPPEVLQGIRLHRMIDTFTDEHDATRAIKSFFRPHYRLYAGAFTDIVYDHFLANDNRYFASPEALQAFAADSYKTLEQQQAFFPSPFQRMFPYMMSQDWFYHYRFREGIEKSFGGLVRRAAYLNESAKAFEVFNLHYAAMQESYTTFFPELRDFTARQLQVLQNS